MTGSKAHLRSLDYRSILRFFGFPGTVVATDPSFAVKKRRSLSQLSTGRPTQGSVLVTASWGRFAQTGV